jgi:hypothetical protein
MTEQSGNTVSALAERLATEGAAARAGLLVALLQDYETALRRLGEAGGIAKIQRAEEVAHRMRAALRGVLVELVVLGGKVERLENGKEG